jgi:EpsI family protein
VAAVAVAATALVWPLMDAAVAPADREPVALPRIDVPGWDALAAPAGFTPRFNGAAATLEQSFRHGDSVAGLYIAYYRNQDAQHRVVSSENVLVPSDDSAWIRVGDWQREALIGGAPHTVRATRLVTRGERSIVAWRWYWIDGATTSSDAVAKARLAWSRLSGHGDDAAAVVLHAVDDGHGSAERTLQAFARDAWPAVAAAFDATRQRP